MTTATKELIDKRERQYKISNPWRANVIQEFIEDLKHLQELPQQEVEISKIKDNDLTPFVEMKSDWLYISYWNVMNVLREKWLFID